MAHGKKKVTVTLHPSGYDAANSVFSGWQNSASNAYTGKDSTSYAQANIAHGAGAEAYVFWTFDTSAIPDEAVIESLSLTAGGMKVGTTGQVSSIYFVVCEGTTEVGEGVAFTVNNRTVQTIDTGNGWTGASIRTLTLKTYGRRGSTNTSYTFGIRLYGADLTITYEY